MFRFHLEKIYYYYSTVSRNQGNSKHPCDDFHSYFGKDISFDICAILSFRFLLGKDIQSQIVFQKCVNSRNYEERNCKNSRVFLSSLFSLRLNYENIRSSRTVVCFLFFLFFFSKKLFDQSKKRTISLSPDNLVRVYYKHVSFCADISQAYQRKAHNYSPWRWRHSTLNVNLKYGCQQSKKTVCNSHE